MKLEIELFLQSGTLFTTRPGHLWVAWGKRTWSDQPNPTNLVNFYFPDFFLKNSQSWFVHEHCSEFSIEELIELFPLSVLEKPVKWRRPDKDYFILTFLDLQGQFVKGSLKKAVPYLFATAEGPMPLFYSLGHLLRYGQANPVHVYGFWEEGVGVLGGTPELLFHTTALGEDHVNLESMACAGTKRTSSEQAIGIAEFLVDPKETTEHQYVVDAIVEALKTVGQVSVGKRSVLQVNPTLLHLVTPIQANLSANCSFTDLVQLLHPTPALGAIPKKAGTDWLLKYQALVPRGRFGAPAGWTYKGLGHCVVGIRNVQWQGTQLRIGGGCGVIPESCPESEWRELQAKQDATRVLLGLL